MASSPSSHPPPPLSVVPNGPTAADDAQLLRHALGCAYDCFFTGTSDQGPEMAARLLTHALDIAWVRRYSFKALREMLQEERPGATREQWSDLILHLAQWEGANVQTIDLAAVELEDEEP